MKPPRPGTVPFELRPGSELFGEQGWRGVNSQRDPGSLTPNELIVGVDIRLKDGVWQTRPGQSLKVTLTALAEHPSVPVNGVSPIVWMREAPVDNPRNRIWLSTLGCFGQATGTGGTLLHIDPTQQPILQNYSYYFATADRQVPTAKYGSDLYIGDGDTLRRIDLLTAPAGISSKDITGSPPNEPIHTFTGYQIRALFEADSKLFISLEDLVTIGSSRIAVWDGLEIIDNDLTGVRPALAFGTWRDKLVAGFDATAANIRVRDPGDSPGTWATVALAGFLCGSQGNVMQEVRDKLYIASGTDLIHSFNGSALALARTIAGCATDGNGVTALCKHEGLLHYGWNTPAGAPGYSSRIGRHDPDSTANEWIDTYKDVTTSQANFIKLSSMLSYRRQIYCGGRQVWVVATAPNVVQGTIQVINSTGAPGLGFEIKQMLRFP